MFSKTETIKQLIEEGTIEPVPDVDPPRWRLTPAGVLQQQFAMLAASWSIAHDITSQLHQHMDEVKDALKQLTINESFTADELDIKNGDDEVEEVSHGYL